MDVNDQLQLRVVNTSEEFYKLKQQWDKILSKLAECPPFLTWEWMYTWWEIYKTTNTHLLILVLQEESEIIAIAPLYIRDSGVPFFLKTVYFLGTGEPEKSEVCSEYLDFICLPLYEKTICNNLSEYFHTNKNIWDRIQFTRILANSSLITNFLPKISAADYHIEKNMGGLRYSIELPELWESYLMSLKPSMRRSIRVARKRIGQYKSYSVELISKEECLEAVMKKLALLHTASWQKRGSHGAFASQEFCEFHHKIAELFLARDRLVIIVIKLSDEVVGILYNFKVKKTNYYYQSGLNLNSYSSLKLGVLLHSEAIKKSIDEKFKRYDFMMAGRNSYKKKYANQISEMYGVCIWKGSNKANILRHILKLPYLNGLR